jgi:hypothetical protein
MDNANRAQWRTASYSGSNGGACIEVAVDPDGDDVLVRDTKDRQGPKLGVSSSAWRTFTRALKNTRLPAISERPGRLASEPVRGVLFSGSPHS